MMSPLASGPLSASRRLAGPAASPYAVTIARLRIRTRLYAARAKVKTQPTRKRPWCRVFLIIPTVFSHPKISYGFDPRQLHQTPRAVERRHPVFDGRPLRCVDPPDMDRGRSVE